MCYWRLTNIFDVQSEIKVFYLFDSQIDSQEIFITHVVFPYICFELIIYVFLLSYKLIKF
jgi:hypothetical protein